MEDTFTTSVTPNKDGIEIFTQHDQTGSASVNGFVPTENIPSLIEELKKFMIGRARKPLASAWG